MSGHEHAKGMIPPDAAAKFRDAQWGARQLGSIAVFKGFSVDELAQLYSQGEILSYRPKSYAVIEGEQTRGLYIILEGTMSVYKNDSSSGAMHRIAYLDAGNNFGELSLFDMAPRSASVAAESLCHVFYLDVLAFNQYLDRLGGDAWMRFYKACAEELVTRFRTLNSDYITAQQLLWRHALRLDRNEIHGSAVKDESATA